MTTIQQHCSARKLPGVLLLVLLFTFGFSKPILAQQQGTITGIVIDAQTGLPLIGANVGVENTLYGAASDEVWPDVTIADVGLFANGKRALGSIIASGTIRLDLVSTDAGRASEIFLDNANATQDDLDDSETNLSAALTLSAPFADNWLASVGIGSVVSTADALERYADRFPASKLQTAAEFQGNPFLEPERSTQGDVWIEGSYPRVQVGFNGFARHMSDYITLEPTEIAPLLPLRPTVFRYMNGEATFYGFEASASYALLDVLSASVGTSYLYGKDTSLDEPALGVSPVSTNLGLRYETTNGRFFAEGVVHAVAEQDQVATTRGETPTCGPGWRWCGA